MPKWTEQQQNAINVRNRNVLVSAAAGSGKTAVLVERVIKLITDESSRVDIDNLLIVTFTNAAAFEMRARIAAALNDILKSNSKSNNALRQLSLLPSAKICTIDSFCINLVRENFFELGINQDFALIDSTKADILADTALNSVLDSYFDNEDKVFLSLLEMFSTPKDSNAFSAVIKKLHTFMYAQPFPFIWLASAVEKYNPSIEMEESEWYGFIINNIESNINFAIRLIKNTIEEISDDDELYESYLSMLNQDLHLFEKLYSSIDKGWNDITDSFKAVTFSRMPYKRGYASPYKTLISSRRGIYKDIAVKNMAKLVCLSKEDYIQDMEHIYPVLKKLYEVVFEFDKEYFILKEENNGYTFADIEQFAISLLYNADKNGNISLTPLASDLSKSFYEILIDEYQDTNRAQDMLFQALSNGRNRFMVGDIKQSIYRFRLAMPEIFNEKKESYRYYDENSEDDSKIILDRNFRSCSEICKYVNFVFSVFMQKGIGDIEYNEDEYLNYGAAYGESKTKAAQLKILTGVKGAQAAESEAVYIAKTILNKIDSKEAVWEKDHFRSIEYGDIAVLLRSSKGYIEKYREVFSSFGIPVVCDNSSNLFESNEIKILCSFLRVIDNPMQDIPLLAVMMSAIYGFTADEMAEIRINHKKGSLYSAVIKSSNDKVKDFLADLEMLRKSAVTMAVSYFIRFLCEYKNIYALANALGNGEQRCRNINKLIDFAKEFDSSDSVGLTSFMRLLDKAAESERGIESPSVNAGVQNAVSIMSIHHSKGLEFPVVILAGTSRKYNMSDLNDKLLLASSGIGVKRHNEQLLYESNTFPYLSMQNMNKGASMGENLRVLYVAMTRAKEQFISFITVDDLSSRLNKLAAMVISKCVDSYLIKTLSSDMDILLLAGIMHKNGKALRDYINQPVDLRLSDFELDIEITDDLNNIEQKPQECAAQADELIMNKIDKRLKFVYDYCDLGRVSAKRNASELDESIKSFKYFASSKPAFMSKGGLTPGQRGTAMHTFMQFCDYNNAKQNIENEINSIKNKGYLSDEEAESIDKNALICFFNSDFAERMLCADNIYREIRVSSFVPLNELENINSDENILIQGISDCVFEENGELVLVDYKTDRVSDEKELLDMYKNQISFYKKAVSKTLGKKVKQAVLYSFYLGKVCYYN